MKQRGISLIEMMLAITVLLGAALGVYVIAARAQVNAAVQREQKQLDAVVEVVQGQFMAAADYAGLTTDQVIRSGRLDIRSHDGVLASGFGSPATVRASTTIDANDSFDVVYEELTTAQCVRLVPALYLKSSDVLVGSPQESVQQTVGAETGRLVDEDILLDACAQPEFERGDGVVAFRFFHPRNTNPTPAAGMGCTCADQEEDQLIGCPLGQAGSIQQRRNGTCTGGTPACPALEWGAWATTNDTCAPVVTPAAPPPVVTPPTQTCFPSSLTRLVPCTAPMTGQITEQMATTCATPTSVPVMGTWTVIASSCSVPATPSAACSPSTDAPRYLPCPAGQGGQIIEQRSSTCDAAGNQVWGAWIETSRTCTASCVASGTCCTPDRQTRTVACSSGSFGGPVDQEQTSSCASATATPAWGGWFDVSGTCTLCPSASAETQTRLVGASGTCPSGQTGSITWDAEEISTRSVSYDCSSGPTSLPAPAVGAWSSWMATGATFNTVNTCMAAATCTPPADTFETRTSTPCPSGLSGIITESRATTYSCPDPSGSPVATPGAWIELSNTCAATCTPPASTSTAISRSLPVENRDAGCPSGYSGSHMQTRTVTESGTRATSWTCPGPTSTVADAWSGTYTYGAWTTTSNTCAAACTPRPTGVNGYTWVADRHGISSQSSSFSHHRQIVYGGYGCPGDCSVPYAVSAEATYDYSVTIGGVSQGGTLSCQQFGTVSGVDVVASCSDSITFALGGATVQVSLNATAHSPVSGIEVDSEADGRVQVIAGAGGWCP